MRRKKRKNYNILKRAPTQGLFWLTISLFIVGIIIIFSATSPISMRLFNGDEYHFVTRHIYSVALSVTLMIIFSKVPFRYFESKAKTIFLVSIFLLVLVFIPGLGIKVLGASRWLNLGILSVQPSEIAKFGLIIYFSYLSIKKRDLTDFLLPTFLVSGLIIIEPDMGTAITAICISLAMIYASGVPMKKIMFLLLFFLVSGLILILSSSYRRDRLMTYLGFEKDTLGKSYHINQVLYALGSGGMFGVGYGQSRQKYSYLPETATDSIFPIFAEEMGFAGSLILIFLLFLYTFKLFRIAARENNMFSASFVFGLASWVSVQTIFNLGSMVALLPLTGIPLPFISYGGTAIVMLGIATGMALNIDSKNYN